MTLKELAHAAHRLLQVSGGCDVKHRHIHELLAAAFGHRSWTVFLQGSLLTDGKADPRL